MKNKYQMIFAGGLVSWGDPDDKQFGTLVDFYPVGDGAISALILDIHNGFTYMDATEITLVEEAEEEE